jgi:hypothetical protein
LALGEYVAFTELRFVAGLFLQILRAYGADGEVIACGCVVEESGNDEGRMANDQSMLKPE